MAAKAGMVWTASNPELLAKALRDAPDRANKFLSRTTVFYSLHAEAYAKQKAPWTDRTGNARASIAGSYEARLSDSGSMFSIDIAHGMPYGIWLEVRFNGRYAILNQTVDVEGRKFFNACNSLLSRMFGGES